MAGALSPRQTYLLDEACKGIREAFGDCPYLVGTAAEHKRKSYRDVDVRLIFADDKYDAFHLAVGADAITFIGFMIGDYLANKTGLNIDFQFQRRTEANEKHKGIRNALGRRCLSDYRGDARPNKGVE